MNEPMLPVGPEDLGEELGDTLLCPQCHHVHQIEYGDRILEDGTKIPTKILAFYKCPETKKTYLAGIDGRRLK